MIEPFLPKHDGNKPEKPKRARRIVKDRHRRIREDLFLARLVNPPEPANRAERRERERQIRRMRSILRGREREAEQKRQCRAERKTRRAARLAHSA